MNEAQIQGGQGGTFTVKADVILHAVHADLASPTKEGGALCPVALRQEGSSLTSDLGYPKDNQTFCSEVPPALMTFQKEYLLDSGFKENHHNDHQPTEASYTSNANQFHISNDHPKQVPPSGTDLNGSHSRNGISEGMNGAGAKAPYSADSSTRAESRADQEVDVPLAFNHGKDQCQNSNVTTPSEHGTVVPDTHCITIGRQPTTLELGLSSSASAHTAEPTQDEHSAPKDSGRNGSAASKKEPDLVIEVGGQKISAHKSVLAEKSDYFRARLSRDILKVKGVNYKTLSILIDYIYTSQMRVQKENVVDVITGAKILQVPCAVQAAVDSMSEQITPENCYEVLTIAKKQRLSELKETAYRFMSDNFLQVLWDPAVYGRLNGSERDLILKKRMEGKKSLMVAEINDVFDRVGSRPPSRNNSRPQSPLSVTSFEDSHMIYYFNETANDWRPLTVMPEDINTKGCGICTMYNYLFVAGGIKGYGDKGKVSDKVFCYNPITNRWSEIRPLNQARSQLKLVSMDGSLYAIGGECLFTVEKYDPRADRWSTVAPLPKGAFAVAHEATTCNGELYVSGGSLFYRLLRYDIKRDEWQECPYNNSRKKSSDMVALKSFIYRFDVNREQGINVFKYNTIVKMWHDCASQRQGSPLPFRCAVIGNCIYCVNKTQTLQFIVEEEKGYFVEEPLRAPLEAKGILFPFILSLPEKPERIV